MDDDSSIASFEEIGTSNRVLGQGFGPGFGQCFGQGFGQGFAPSGEDINIKKLKSLIAKSATNGDKATELAEDEVPDVCYVLQYKEPGGKLNNVRRSKEPINVQLNDIDEKGVSSTKKSILEIVTKVMTVPVKKRRPAFPPPPLPHQDWNPYDDHAFRETYRQKEDENEAIRIANIEVTSMVINSVHLINALKAVVGYYPGKSFLGDSVTISAPYQVLVHNSGSLARYKVSQPKTHDEEYALTTVRHIDVLLNYLDKSMGDMMLEERKRHNSSIPSATFDNLWLILKPGEVVYAKQDYKWTPFVISCVHNGYYSDDGPVSYVVDCWNITYVSERFCRTMHSFSIQPFTSEEAIMNLAVIPARFFKGEDGKMAPKEVTAKQIMLGKKVWELSKGPSYKSYDGSLVEKEPDFNWNYPTSATGYMSGRVIVDCAGFQRYSVECPGESRRRGRSPPPPNQRPPPKDQLPYFAPSCGCNACNKVNSKENLSPFASFEDLDPTTDAASEVDLYYLVLSKVLSGFILGERRWGHFNVEHLREVEFDGDAFNYLVLDEEIKLTVRALIGKFASANGRVTPWPNDFVKNKGQGRIFLLHGSPGVGKTCTAECVAELTHRPLLSLTSGDLSTNSYQVEKNLEYFLQLGERFGAMVLLDEADVYLEARRAKDIARNGLVSIFLRALEYYRGVLFLTTNRVQTFDSAFTSRIHVALHYKALADADREKIWLNSFERLERDSAGKVHVSVATREYAYESADVRSLRWNGREIRNALQTTVALAETEALEAGCGDKVTVTDRHLRSVVKMSRGFKNFLRRQKLKGDNGLEEDGDDEELPENDGRSPIFDN
ncbi:P-loop containing nucleoside triphosphate hydrolase protein [Hypoxylon crocopeplum]|nr:P-loop containing nucleoside triphosphate hydrolase protein [Hypoxylon crocopeplum]